MRQTGKDFFFYPSLIRINFSFPYKNPGYVSYNSLPCFAFVERLIYFRPMVRLIITVAYYNMITHFIIICALIQRKSLRRKQFVALTLHINICAMTSKDGSMVRYASIFVKKYGTLVRYVFFVMVRVRYVGTVRLFREGTGTVRWYAF